MIFADDACSCPGFACIVMTITLRAQEDAVVVQVIPGDRWGRAQGLHSSLEESKDDLMLLLLLLPLLFV